MAADAAGRDSETGIQPRGEAVGEKEKEGSGTGHEDSKGRKGARGRCMKGLFQCSFHNFYFSPSFS